MSAPAKASSSASPSEAARPTGVMQSHLSRSVVASFRHQNLNMESVIRIMAQLDSIKALDLSYNKLNSLPKLLPPKMIAIDLSYNPIKSLHGFTDVANIVELKLNYNKIESCLGLATAINLEYLELSHNRVVQVEGLENCSNLRVINLSHNAIATTLHIRPLSLNLLLAEVDLRGNTITDIKQYKVAVLGLLSTLSKLDGVGVRSGGGRAVKNYSQKFDDRIKGIIKQDPSLRYLAEGAIYTSGYYNGNGDYSSHYTNDSDDDVDVHVAFDDSESQLPWRRPPNPTPNPLKFERKKRRGECSPALSPRTRLHRTRGPHHHGRPPSQHHHEDLDSGRAEGHLAHTQAESAASKYYQQNRREQSSSSKHRNLLQLPGSPRKDSSWSSPELNRRSKPANRAELVLGPPLQSPARTGIISSGYRFNRSNIENESSAIANASANVNLTVSTASLALLLPPPLPAEMGTSRRGGLGDSLDKSSLEKLWEDDAGEGPTGFMDALDASDRTHEYSTIYYLEEEEELMPPPLQRQQERSAYGSLRMLHRAINGVPPAAGAPPTTAPAAGAAPSAPLAGGPDDADHISSEDIKRALLDLTQRKKSSLAALQARMHS